MILFINACVRKDSRTRRLADALLSEWNEPVTELRLADIDFPVTSEEYLSRRDRLTAAEKFSDPMFDRANQFAAADRIVIAAPHWDLSFPASLKQYIEHINVVGITFIYTSEGIPQGLCRAKELYYVSTAGGNYVPEEYGFGYVEALARNFYGIPVVKKIQAAGLDIDGADPEQILKETMEQIRAEKTRQKGDADDVICLADGAGSSV